MNKIKKIITGLCLSLSLLALPGMAVANDSKWSNVETRLFVYRPSSGYYSIRVTSPSQSSNIKIFSNESFKKCNTILGNLPQNTIAWCGISVEEINKGKR